MPRGLSGCLTARQIGSVTLFSVDVLRLLFRAHFYLCRSSPVHAGSQGGPGHPHLTCGGGAPAVPLQNPLIYKPQISINGLFVCVAVPGKPLPLWYFFKSRPFCLRQMCVLGSGISRLAERFFWKFALRAVQIPDQVGRALNY